MKGVVVFIVTLVAIFSMVSAVWSISLPVFNGSLITGNVISFPVDTVPMYAATNGISWMSCATTCAARSIAWTVYTTDPAEAISMAASTVCAAGNGFGPCPPVGDPKFYLVKNPEDDKTVPVYKLRITKDVIAGQAKGFESLRKPITYLYTTHDWEKDSAISQGWSLQGTVGYLYKTQQPGSVPISRSFFTATNLAPPKDIYKYGSSSGSLLGYGYMDLPECYGSWIPVSEECINGVMQTDKWNWVGSSYGCIKPAEPLPSTQSCTGIVGSQCTSNSQCSTNLCTSGVCQNPPAITPVDSTTPASTYVPLPQCTEADWMIVPQNNGQCVYSYTGTAVELRKITSRINTNCSVGSLSIPYQLTESCPNLPPISPTLSSIGANATHLYGKLTYPTLSDASYNIHLKSQTVGISMSTSAIERWEGWFGGIIHDENTGNFVAPIPIKIKISNETRLDFYVRAYDSPSNGSIYSRYNSVLITQRYYSSDRGLYSSSILPPRGFIQGNSVSPGSSSVINNVIPTNVAASNVTTPLCTEADWQSVISPASCPSSGVQIKTWNQIGRCVGGVNHTNQQETVTCTSVVTTQTDPNSNVSSFTSGVTTSTDPNSNVSTSGPISCESFTYTAWNTCADGVQSRSFTGAFPFGCTGGNPLTVQACTSAVGGSCTSNGQCDSGLACMNAVCQVPPQPIADTAPYGSTLPMEGTTLRGWTGDADCVSQGCSVELHFYMDAPAGDIAAFIGSTIADKQFPGTEKNNYAFALPGGYPNEQSHTVYVYALGKDAQGNNNGNNILLGTTNIVALPSAVVATSTTASCTDFTYSDWSACSPSGTQSRTVTGSSPAECIGGNPITSQQCNYVPTCTESDWQAIVSPIECPTHGLQSLSWTKIGQCESGVSKTGSSISCDYNAPTCNFDYSDWSACSPSGTRTRSITSTYPSSCEGGTPFLVEACVYTPLCTDLDWQSTLVPAVCPESAFQAKLWNKIGICEGGVTHSSQENVRCIPPVTATQAYSCFGGQTPGSVPCPGQQDGLSSDTPNTLTTGQCDGATRCQYWCGAQGQYDWDMGACVPAGNSGSTSQGSDNTVQAPQSTDTETNPGSATSETTEPGVGDNVLNRNFEFVLGLARGMYASITGFVVGGESQSVSACIEFTYTNWSACSQSGTQSRAVVSSGPASCTGGNPVVVQQCQYTPLCTDTDWQTMVEPIQCPASSNGQYSFQTVYGKKIGQCEGGVDLSQRISFVCNPQTQITPDNLNLSDVKNLVANGTLNVTSPSIVRNITSPAGQNATPCTSFTYTNWSACSQSGTQGRYIVSATPSGCSGGVPVTSQTCTDNSNLNRGATSTSSGCVDASSCKLSPKKCPTWGEQTKTCYNTCIKQEVSEEVSCTPGSRTSSTAQDSSDSEVGFGKKIVCKVANLFDSEGYEECLA